MRQELDDALCAAYPHIFRDRHGDMSKTLMCWGFSCGDGWYPLIDELCAALMLPANRAKRTYEDAVSYADTPEPRPVWMTPYLYSEHRIQTLHDTWQNELARVPVAVQVKEKFGRLCFYVTQSTDEQFAMTRFAERMSTRICEYCGQTDGTKTYRTGWHKTLCPTCADKEGYREQDDDEAV